MGDVFHDWRRKAGAITLVMACAIAGLWVRSYVAEDHFPSVFNDLRSRGGGIEESVVFWRTSRYRGRSFAWEERQIHWRIPYGVVAIPLTLLSAGLLLARPRKPA